MATEDTVRDALDALETALDLVAQGWGNAGAFDDDLPPGLTDRPWRVAELLSREMPAFGQIAWPRLLDARRWRSLHGADLSEAQCEAVARWWVKALVGDLLRSAAAWLEQGLRIAGSPEQIDRAGALLIRYLEVPGVRQGSLVMMLRRGTGERAVEVLRRIEDDERYDSAIRWWARDERWYAQGENLDAVPDYVEEARGEGLAQVRQVFRIDGERGPEPYAPVALSFEDGTAFSLRSWTGGISFHLGAEDAYPDAAGPLPPDGLAMVDLSSGPLAWEAVAQPLTHVTTHLREPEHPGVAAVAFTFEDVEMLVRLSGDLPDRGALRVVWTRTGA
ncbi:hypothetical protein ACIBF1_16750 [Spirillospora sp. NPDC050679]